MILLVGIFVLVCIVIWFLQKAKAKWDGLPPGPFRFPLIGCMVQIVMEHELPFIAFYRMSKYYGSIFYIQMGIVDAVAINGYEACTEALTNEDFLGRMDEKWQLERTFQKPIGLIFAHVDIWKETRRFCTRGLREFGFGVKNTMESLILEELDEFSASIVSKTERNNGVLSVYQLFNAPILNSAWSMVTGRRFNYDDPKLAEILALVDLSFKSGGFGAGLLTAYPFLSEYAPKLVKFDRQIIANEGIKKYLWDILHEARARGEYKTNPTNFVEVYLQKIDSKDHGPDEMVFTDEALVTVLFDFLFASAETAGNTLAFGILYMVLNPDVQDKVFDEIESVVGNRRVALADKDRLIYTEATLLEIYRISNVVPFGPRKLEKDATIGKYNLKKGTTVFVNLYSVTMDEKVWGDPHVFRPERFLDRKGKIINADKFFPFGLGKRNCIGEAVAKADIFLIFTGLIQQFNFAVNPEEGKPSLEPVLGFSISPKPFSALVTPRH